MPVKNLGLSHYEIRIVPNRRPAKKREKKYLEDCQRAKEKNMREFSRCDWRLGRINRD